MVMLVSLLMICSETSISDDFISGNSKAMSFAQTALFFLKKLFPSDINKEFSCISASRYQFASSRLDLKVLLFNFLPRAFL